MSFIDVRTKPSCRPSVSSVAHLQSKSMGFLHHDRTWSLLGKRQEGAWVWDGYKPVFRRANDDCPGTRTPPSLCSSCATTSRSGPPTTPMVSTIDGGETGEQLCWADGQVVSMVTAWCVTNDTHACFWFVCIQLRTESGNAFRCFSIIADLDC